MDIELKSRELLEALTYRCENVANSRSKLFHPVYESCAQCIEGRSLNSDGMKIAALFAKHLKSKGTRED